MSDKKQKRVGSRAEVWHGTAHHTSGGLTKGDLTQNKYGRIVSKRKQALGRQLYRQYKHVLQANQFTK